MSQGQVQASEGDESQAVNHRLFHSPTVAILAWT
jgi:hypothetical protein